MRIRAVLRRISMRSAHGLDRGQGLVELTLTLPVLLTVTFGVLELGMLLDVTHQISSLTREGASIASRGAPLDSVLLITTTNGRSVGLMDSGGAIVSEIEVQNGVPVILDQVASGGYIGTSRLGLLGATASALVGQGLRSGQLYYAVEVFAPYQSFTPLDRLVGAIVPDVLYDRTVF